MFNLFFSIIFFFNHLLQVLNGPHSTVKGAAVMCNMYRTRAIDPNKGCEPNKEQKFYLMNKHFL